MAFTAPDQTFRVNKIKALLGLASRALLHRIEGRNSKGELRCVFNLAQSVVVIKTNQQKQHYFMRDFLGPNYVALQFMLLRLTWQAPGGFEGEPLELLAMCDL